MWRRNNRFLYLQIILILLPSCVKNAQEEQNPFSQEYESHSGLPQILVSTGGTPVDRQFTGAAFCIDGQFLHGSIRGRGNATWEYEKKPYKIRLDGEQPLFGMGKSTDWVLLAEYRDLSLMRTAFMFELARLAGLPYTLGYRHVELYLNDEYQGIYVLAECVQRSPSRIDIDDDGFIIEDDQYWENEAVSFESTLDIHYTFKYPGPGNLDEGRLKSISAYICRMERSLLAGDTEEYLDLDSFSKWYLVTELLGVYDPNIYYVLKSRGDKLMMGPVWDAESALGLFGRGSDGLPPAPGSIATGYPICGGNYYFPILLRSPLFVDCLKRNWDALKPLLPAYKNQMRALFQGMEEALEANFKRWPVDYTRCWEAEFDFIHDYFQRREAWFDGYMSYLAAPKSTVPLEADISNPAYPVPDAIDLGLSVLWASCNLGAADERETGYFFAWGETEPKDEYSWATYAYGDDSGTVFTKYAEDGLVELDYADDPARAHLGGKWRMPTRWELWELWDYLNYGDGELHYETRDGMSGFRVSSPDTGGSLFFPCAGRVDGGSIESFGIAGYYWTSSLAGNGGGWPAGAYFLGVDGTIENVNDWNCGRYYGMPVRPVSER